MKSQVLQKILRLTGYQNHFSVYSKFKYDHHRISFSQEGEDLVLNRLFEHQNKGFYVDIGAHHPQRFSNTYLFYLKGWHGLNIDAMPGCMDKFNEMRDRDINIESAISSSEQELTYYIFNEPALNGFSSEISTSRDGYKNFRIIEEKKIRTQKLSSLLDQHLSDGQIIDFMTIDVEGLDYEVLLSNNWEKYKPKVLLVEELSASLEQVVSKSRAYALLHDHGYRLLSKTYNTSFYQRIDI